MPEGALGSALFIWHQQMNNERKVNGNGRDSQKGSYLGPYWTSDQIEKWLKKKGYKYHRHTPEEIFGCGL